jgi:hypothetical protein
MVERELITLVAQTYEFFNRHEPKKGAVDLWLGELKFIPSEAVPWITARMRKGKFPDNFPMAIKNLWSVWLAENPEKRDREEKGCDECEQGIIWVVKDGHEDGFRCANCRSDHRTGIPARRAKDLLAQGYELQWIHLSTAAIKGLPGYAKGQRFLKQGLSSVGEILKPVNKDPNPETPIPTNQTSNYLNQPYQGQF